MYHAAHGLDQYVRENFFQDFNYKGIMAEIGAGPPEFISSSKHWRDNGWRCICVDPNPKFVQQHQQLGNEIYNYAISDREDFLQFYISELGGWPQDLDGISNSSLGFRFNDDLKSFVNPITSTIDIECLTLDTLLSKIGVDHLDYLNVDVEGWELEVIKGFTPEKYQTKIIVLENYKLNPNYEIYMNSIGYRLEKRIAPWNDDVYVRI